MARRPGKASFLSLPICSVGLLAAASVGSSIAFATGTDPYAYKGTTDIAQASIRPDGQGGCADGRKLV